MGTLSSKKDMQMTKFIRRPAVERMTGLARSTIYAMMQDGRFPKAVSLGGRAVGWPEAEVINWIEDCIAKRAGSDD